MGNPYLLYSLYSIEFYKWMFLWTVSGLVWWGGGYDKQWVVDGFIPRHVVHIPIHAYRWCIYTYLHHFKMLQLAPCRKPRTVQWHWPLENPKADPHLLFCGLSSPLKLVSWYSPLQVFSWRWWRLMLAVAAWHPAASGGRRFSCWVLRAKATSDALLVNPGKSWRGGTAKGSVFWNG